MGDRYGRSDINEITIGMSIWDMGYRFGTRYIDMVIYHIDMVILEIDMGYLVTLPARPPTRTTAAPLPRTLRTRRVRSGGTTQF